MNDKKVLVVGIDGATFKIIKPLIARGRLPYLSMMLENGVHGNLNSTIPAISPVAWTSFMTGKGPEKHQIFDFTRKVEGTYDFKPNTTLNRKAKPFWMNLSENNKRVFVLGVTMTFPPDPVNGYMVSGLGMPRDSEIESYTYPPQFKDELVDKFGEYLAVPKADLRKLYNSDKEKDKYLKGIFDQIDYRVNLFKSAWGKDDFDFSMVFFLDTDGISHYFWKYMDSTHAQYCQNTYSDAIYKVYEKVDSAIGELLDIISDDTDVIIVSDHGFGPLNKVVFLNNWLKAKGYLEFVDIPAVSRAFLKLKDMAKRRGNRGKRGFDWSKTKAYFSGTTGNIFVNKSGRDPKGIVDGSKYDALCDELIAELKKLEDPETGQKVVEQAYKSEELFKSKNIPIAPDIVVTFKSGYSVVGEEISLHGIKDTGEIISDAKNWSGTHDPDGVFVAYGKNFKKGYGVHDISLIDIAPTILHLLGVAVPKSMDGEVIADIFEPDLLDSNAVTFVEDDDSYDLEAEELSEADNQKLRDQLRNLGYIE